MKRSGYLALWAVMQLIFAGVDGTSQTTTQKPPPPTTPLATTPQFSETDFLQQQIDELNQQVADLTALVASNQQSVDTALDVVDAEIDEIQDDIVELEDDLETVVDTININNAKPLCQDYKDAGVEESGYYQIDPDGDNGSIPPYEVYCDFDSDPDVAITKLGHDSENRTLVNGCEDPGCYSKDISYLATMDQIVALLAKSDSCQQYIKYECFDSMLFHYDVEAWWKSRDGVNQYYWGGAAAGSKMCRCGVEKNCDLNSTTCNCDNNDQEWREDDGYFTDIDVLPVTQVNFGDTEALDERGYYTLGKLECKGRAVHQSCASLKRNGSPSGYYTINPSPISIEDFEVYCDMESFPGTGVTVLDHNANKTNTYLQASTYCSGYDKVVDYGVSMEKIEYLVNISDHCTQFIEWLCYRTGFLYSGYSWWLSRNGDKMTYWGGAEPEHDGYCACGETGSCAGGGTYYYKCNCDDTSMSSLRIDSGELVDKRVLPVTGLHFGFYSCSSSYHGYYTLGPLKCF